MLPDGPLLAMSMVTTSTSGLYPECNQIQVVCRRQVATGTIRNNRNEVAAKAIIVFSVRLPMVRLGFPSNRASTMMTATRITAAIASKSTSYNHMLVCKVCGLVLRGGSMGDFLIDAPSRSLPSRGLSDQGRWKTTQERSCAEMGWRRWRSHQAEDVRGSRGHGVRSIQPWGAMERCTLMCYQVLGLKL
jgi:hypothetical protein